MHIMLCLISLLSHVVIARGAKLDSPPVLCKYCEVPIVSRRSYAPCVLCHNCTLGLLCKSEVNFAATSATDFFKSHLKNYVERLFLSLDDFLE